MVPYYIRRLDFDIHLSFISSDGKVIGGMIIPLNRLDAAFDSQYFNFIHRELKEEMMGNRTFYVVIRTHNFFVPGIGTEKKFIACQATNVRYQFETPVLCMFEIEQFLFALRYYGRPLGRDGLTEEIFTRNDLWSHLKVENLFKRYRIGPVPVVDDDTKVFGVHGLLPEEAEFENFARDQPPYQSSSSGSQRSHLSQGSSLDEICDLIFDCNRATSDGRDSSDRNRDHTHPLRDRMDLLSANSDEIIAVDHAPGEEPISVGGSGQGSNSLTSPPSNKYTRGSSAEAGRYRPFTGASVGHGIVQTDNAKVQFIDEVRRYFYIRRQIPYEVALYLSDTNNHSVGEGGLISINPEFAIVYLEWSGMDFEEICRLWYSEYRNNGNEMIGVPSETVVEFYHAGSAVQEAIMALDHVFHPLHPMEARLVCPYCRVRNLHHPVRCPFFWAIFDRDQIMRGRRMCPACHSDKCMLGRVDHRDRGVRCVSCNSTWHIQAACNDAAAWSRDFEPAIRRVHYIIAACRHLTIGQFEHLRRNLREARDRFENNNH